MTTRKVSQIGPSTLMVSLPSKWVKEFGIKKGDEIDIETTGRNLIITTSKLKENKILKINLEGLNANLIRYIIYTVYRIGTNEIELYFENEKVIDQNTNAHLFVIDIIQQITENLIGFEIISQRENVIKIKQISTINIEEFTSTLKRIFFTLTNMSDDLTNAIENKNKELLQRIKELTNKKINKLSDFCHRIINKGGIIETNKAPQYYLIISILEEIGDSIENICNVAMNNKTESNDIQKLTNLLTALYKLFCNTNNNNLNLFYSLKNEIKNIKTIEDIKIEMSKIASYCSKLIPEIIALNIENERKYK